MSWDAHRSPGLPPHHNAFPSIWTQAQHPPKALFHAWHHLCQAWNKSFPKLGTSLFQNWKAFPKTRACTKSRFVLFFLYFSSWSWSQNSAGTTNWLELETIKNQINWKTNSKTNIPSIKNQTSAIDLKVDQSNQYLRASKILIVINMWCSGYIAIQRYIDLR